ncbi:hypothetical protein AMTRI_Chr03g43680 [Amborella trichopoda]
MATGEEAQGKAPLLEPSQGAGTSSSLQTLGNIVVSIVGTGILGLPFAFKVAGWLPGSLGVAIVGLSMHYTMNLLVRCRSRLEADGSMDVLTFGDLAEKALGMPGRYLTETLVLISQSGGSVAYLIFIGQNLSSLFKFYSLDFSLFIFLLVPIEIALSWIRSLSSLAPFSAFADLCNVLAMAIVVREDLQLFSGFSNAKAITTLKALPFTGGVAVFCFEGFSMTLALEASMVQRENFYRILSLAFSGITLVYIIFGFFGYLAYGDQTRDIITLNLTNSWSAMAVKIGLCVGLTFTFPIMMHPIHEILEKKMREVGWVKKVCNDVDRGERIGVYMLRSVMVLVLAIIASFVPGFGAFISLVGSTVCALLSYVLPSLFHMRLLGSDLSLRRKVLDGFILVLGLVFAGYGTLSALSTS